jgi:hypothetical protein
VFDKEKGTAGEIATHIWWTLGDKPEYVIPTERESELLSEYAKAHLRGGTLRDTNRSNTDWLMADGLHQSPSFRGALLDRAADQPLLPSLF